MTTIYDVAKSAGVSAKTVSRVLNKDRLVAKSTRDKVQSHMAALGYVPSHAARSMRAAKSGLIGLITGAISLTPDRSEASGLPDLFIVQGIQTAIEGSGKTLLIADTGGRQERVPGLIRTFEEHRVEGLIYVADFHKRISLPLVSEATKLILANCYDDRGTPCVLPDDRKGQKQLVEALIAKGHRRIGYLTLSPTHDATILRTEGYRDALDSAGIAYDPAMVIPVDIVDGEARREEQLLWDAIDRILSLPEPPTALCFGNDRMAMRAYGILRSRGLSLPNDISLAGYDNHRMITETLYPPLTSVDLPYHAIGIRAMQIMLHAIENATDIPAAPVLVSGQVHHRQSVAGRAATVIPLLTTGRKTT